MLPILSSLETPDGAGQIFTPKELVSGFIDAPRNASSIEAAWHAAAVALDTERVRLVHHEADGGVYFLAADASDFADFPNAITPLAAALPGAEGHKGDGAYFIDLAAGIVGVVLKGPKLLKCFVGDRNQAIQFAGELTQFWPTECEAWVGYRQLESRNTNRLAKIAIFAGIGITSIFIGATIFISWKSASLLSKHDDSLMSIHAEQQKIVDELSAHQPEAFTEYRKVANAISKKGGVLIHIESTGNKSSFDAQFPLWASDLNTLGQGLTTKIEDNHIIVSRDGA